MRIPPGFSPQGWDCWDREWERHWCSEYGDELLDPSNARLMWDRHVWCDGKCSLHTLVMLSDECEKTASAENSRPDSKNLRNEDDTRMRGLIVHSVHMDKILAGEKKYEIRNTACQCLGKLEEFYLLRVPPKGQGKNINGQSVLEVVGTAIFQGHHFIRHEDFDQFYHFHKVSPEQYEKMRKSWKRDTGGCYAWELELGFVFNPPRYLPSGNQDCDLGTRPFCGCGGVFQIAFCISASLQIRQIFFGNHGHSRCTDKSMHHWHWDSSPRLQT